MIKKAIRNFFADFYANKLEKLNKVEISASKNGLTKWTQIKCFQRSISQG
jgi:hypothetical protein